jgi:DNA modification methylase
MNAGSSPVRAATLIYIMAPGGFFINHSCYNMAGGHQKKNIAMKNDQHIHFREVYKNAPIRERVVFSDGSFLLRGRAEEIIEGFENPVADCVITDPPYLLTSGGNNPKDASKRMKGCFSDDNYNNSGQLVTCDICWPEITQLCYKVLQDPGHAYIMANNRNLADCDRAAQNAGFKFHNWLVWDKKSATPNRWYMKNAEFTGFFYKGKAFEINNCSSMACVRYPQHDTSDHPTEKPVGLMEMYVRNSTKQGDVVLDPFMGSGTTGVAAIRNKRRFLGIELEQKWFDVAVQRISDALGSGQERLL